MSNNTETLLTLTQLLSEEVGDWIEVDTTTNIAANTSIISTNLLPYDYGSNDYFNNWWVYITEGNNIGVERQISDYATTTGTITVRGGALAAEAGAVTIRVSRFSRANKVKGIQKAIRAIFPGIYRKIYNQELITGNILPPFIWTSSSALYKYTTSNITLAQTTTGGLFWNGESSAKATAGADNGYITLTSASYPKLLDLMGQTVNYRCWALPEVADDPTLVIYTKQADTTAQTLTSTTSAPVTEFTLLELESQALNSDLVEVEFRLKVGTNTKYVYFDRPRVLALDVREYLLPQEFQDGQINRCFIQDYGHAGHWCDDLHPQIWREVEFDVVDDGVDKYLQLQQWEPSERIIQLEGITPLESLTSDTGTVTVDDDKVDALIKRAEYEFWKIERGSPSAEDAARYEYRESKALAEYREAMVSKRMARASVQLRRA